MKYSILKFLKDSDGFVSGEDISSSLGVSRTAVWKHINELKQEGYVIESSSRKGYKLIESPDRLTKQELMPFLNTRYVGRHIVYFDSIGSTNDEARKIASKGSKEGLVVIAEEQTSGRGRMGRKWTTPKYQAIAFSVVIMPKIKPEESPGITLVMGTAVCRAIREVCSLDAGIKWPNDIIINNKKVCGILTELSAEIDAVNYIIIGVGINANVERFPEEIKEIATSIYLESGRKVSRKELISKVFLEFENLYEDYKINGLKNIIDEFKSYSVTLNKRVNVTSINESFKGQAADILSDGTLVIKLDDGSERKVLSGDVSVRGIGGYV